MYLGVTLQHVQYLLNISSTVVPPNLFNQTNTLQPLYNKVRYNMVFDLTQFKDGSQKCIDYIEK